MVVKGSGDLETLARHCPEREVHHHCKTMDKASDHQPAPSSGETTPATPYGPWLTQGEGVAAGGDPHAGGGAAPWPTAGGLLTQRWGAGQ